jgi:hypothetical protein
MGWISIHDIVLPQVYEFTNEVAPLPIIHPATPKVETQFVAKPAIRRYVHSTPSLHALDDQVLGDSDAMPKLHEDSHR